MSDPSQPEFEAGDSISAARLIEVLSPGHRAEALVDAVRRGDDELIHAALVIAADSEDFVHAQVLFAAAGLENADVAMEAVRSQAAIEGNGLRIKVLGRGLWSTHEAVALEATDRIRDPRFREDSRDQLRLSDALATGVKNTKSESVALQILDIATEPGIHGTSKEFRIVRAAQHRSSFGVIGRLARARVVEMKKADPSFDEFSYRY
jgi:hypothetical protein